jgi:hypothetical protein
MTMGTLSFAKPVRPGNISYATIPAIRFRGCIFAGIVDRGLWTEREQLNGRSDYENIAVFPRWDLMLGKGKSNNKGHGQPRKMRYCAITEIGDMIGCKFSKNTSQTEAPTLAGSVMKDCYKKKKTSGCWAQQTGVHEMVMEALLIAIYSTWVTS